MDYIASRQRRNNGGTPFTNWIRRQPGLESNVKVGYVGTDIDLVWYNYVLAMLMLLEQKIGREEYTPSQRVTLSVIDQWSHFAYSGCTLETPKGCLPIPPKVRYRGLHVIRFENSSPEDGCILVDNIPVTLDQFKRFLKFEWMPPHQGKTFAQFHSDTYWQPTHKKRRDKSLVPTLFNQSPILQQDLWEAS